MNKKEFKRAMCCGLGRCVQELKETGSIEKYRDIVLWGCTHDLAYDAQCEGTRGWYLYCLANCFPDVDFFVESVAASFYKSSAKQGWAFDQFCDFLCASANDGNQAARRALWENYGRMYGLLRKKRKRQTNGCLPLYDNFEKLCIALVDIEATCEDAKSVYVRIVRDVGELMLENPLFATWRFDWFQACQENTFGKSRLYRILKESAGERAGIAKYRAAMLRESADQKKRGSERKRVQASLTAQRIYEKLRDGEETDRLFPLMQARLMRRLGGEDEVRKLAGLYQREKSPALRARLLALLANRDCADLPDVEAVLADACSEDATLRGYAFRVLAHRKDVRVRRFALELWKRGGHTEDVIYMLACNYEPEDHDRLVSLVKALPVTYEERDVHWHGPFQAVLDLLEKRGLKRPPKELLSYMYEHTLCSCCREYVLREMRRRRMLTEELLLECRYDCNEAVRAMAGFEASK